LIPPLLFSYHYVRAVPYLRSFVERLLATGKVDIMYDSGAYSAHHSGSQIDLKDYIDFIKASEQIGAAYGYIALDVIENKVETQRNLDAMVASGVRPIPVLTLDEDIRKIKDLAQINRRICLAGKSARFGGAINWFCKRVRECDKLAPDLQLHALAFVRVPEMYQIPLASVDSSSHNSGFRYGHLFRFDPSSGSLSLTPYKKVVHSPTSEWPSWLMPMLASSGLRPDQWKDKTLMSTSGYSVVGLYTMFAMLCQGRYAQQRYGLRVFQAIASPDPIVSLAILEHSRCASVWSFDVQKAITLCAQLKAMDKVDRMKRVCDMILEVA
jgi:hypothetical protein